MKKSTLRPFNKNALKTAALLAVASAMIGYHTYIRTQDKISKETKIDDFKEELVQYEAAITATEPERIENNDDYQSINISNSMPKIAIIYQTDGNVCLLINRELLTLAAATEKYPTLTAGIKKHIADTHKQIEAIKTME